MHQTKGMLVSLFLTMTPLLAEGATPIPLEGMWEIDGTTNPRFWKTMRDQTGISFRVNECGYKITMFNSQVVGGNMTLEFDGAEYRGHGQWINKGEGNITANLEPVNEKLMRGKMFFTMEPAPAQEWDMTVRYQGEADTPDPGQGTASRFLTEDSGWESAGLFREQERQWLLRLSGFHANSPTVLENHAVAIQAIRDDEESHPALPPTQEKEQPRMCESLTHRFGAIEGFADSGIEKNSPMLPTQRARAVFDVVVAYNWPVDSAGPGTAWNNGTGSTQATIEFLPDANCPRAALAPYRSKRSYVYPYTRQEADKWLRQWLQDVKEAAGDDEPLWVTQDAILKQKSRWCLANSLLDMLEDDVCDIPTRFDANGKVASSQTIEHYALKGVPVGSDKKVTYQYAQRGKDEGERAGQIDGNIIYAWDVMNSRSKTAGTQGAGAAKETEGEDAAKNLAQSLGAIAPSSPYVYNCGRSDADTVKRRKHADSIENAVFDQFLPTPWTPGRADPTKDEYFDPDNETPYEHVPERDG